MTGQLDAVVQAALADFNGRRIADAESKLLSLGPALADHALGLQLLSLLAAQRSRAESDALLERAVRIAPGDGQAHFNAGVAVQSQNDLARATLHYQQALRLDPDHLGALNNLSDLMRRRGRGEEGWAALNRYRELGGPMTGLEVRMAKLGMDTQRWDDASQWFEEGERAKPGDASTEFEHSMLLLARKDWARGWPRYDRRIQLHGVGGLGIYPYPMAPWRGEPLRGKSVLLHREQGLGDMIMFAGCVPGICDEAADVHLAMHPPLVRLFARNFPKAKVWPSNTAAGHGVQQPDQPWRQVAGPINYQLPACSLGTARHIDGFSGRPYLRAHDGDAALWKARLDLMCRLGRKRVGLCLGSRPTGWSEDGRRMAANKSIPPREAALLAEVSGVEWVGLHDRETAWMLADVPGLEVVDCAPYITDLADTAAIIANLDVVVTIDSAVAHLAGAMGKPTLLLLWWNADWRWELSGETSTMYPNTTMLRQSRAHDWQPVIAEALRRLN
jgi:hypothetical protein